MKFLHFIISFLLLFFVTGWTETKGPIRSFSKSDKCPVCGMFVNKYPDWIAQILFKDGSYAVFDGVKDMMKFYFNIKKYSPKRELSDIDRIYVRDYYSLNYIDAQKAFYVIGSDVYGPMGRELIPFGKESDARVFMKDHRGQRLLTFPEITIETLKSLE